MPTSALRTSSLMIIFTYAPVGLGHLRVTDALYHGLPQGTPTPFLLGSQDTSVNIFYRFMSIHPAARMVMELIQRGIFEDIFTLFYTIFLRSHTQVLYTQITTLIDQQIIPPKTLLVVATHFGLAQQVAAIKEKIEKNKHVRVILVVQVTDDTPQHIWYVSGADSIFVPSHKTKQALESYGKFFHLPKVPFEVLSYPLSPVLQEKLPVHLIENRVQQVEKESTTAIHVAIPISGAAIGLGFLMDTMDTLHEKSSRFRFHIVTRQVAYTKQFIVHTKNLPYVHLSVSETDREVIDAYETLYQKEMIALEITKPSEQAFKALLDCEKRGASLLLFSEPIGVQEEDNLDFLQRHFLIPHKKEQQILWEMAEKNISLTDGWFEKAARWRGISLQTNPTKAATFILWCLQEGIFAAMMTCKVKPHPDDPHVQEMQSNGVETFWQKVSKLLLP